MTKSEYVESAMKQPIQWLINCANDPSDHMRPIHVKLLKIAIRRKMKNSF